MLVTLEKMKEYLGETTTDYDDFLTQQIIVVSDAIEGYCGRVFNEASYTQTFYADEMSSTAPDKIMLFHYPVTVISSVTMGPSSNILDADEYRSQKVRGIIKRVIDDRRSMWFSDNSTSVVVVYTAGYADTPPVIEQVVFSLVSENYNKKKSGIGLDFGSDVQSISIPGTLTINFDYTLQANDRTTKYGMIIGNYANTLDPYRSERAVVGSIEGSYVE